MSPSMLLFSWSNPWRLVSFLDRFSFYESIDSSDKDSTSSWLLKEFLSSSCFINDFALYFDLSYTNRSTSSSFSIANTFGLDRLYGAIVILSVDETMMSDLRVSSFVLRWLNISLYPMLLIVSKGYGARTTASSSSSSDKKSSFSIIW